MLGFPGQNRLNTSGGKQRHVWFVGPATPYSGKEGGGTSTSLALELPDHGVLGISRTCTPCQTTSSGGAVASVVT
jgi:hypothetical protein